MEQLLLDYHLFSLSDYFYVIVNFLHIDFTEGLHIYKSDEVYCWDLPSQSFEQTLNQLFQIK